MLTRQYFAHFVPDDPAPVVEQIEKTTATTGVAGNIAHLLNLHQNCVAITIEPQFFDVLDVSGCLTFFPKRLTGT